ncbi:RNA recognition motif. (a.k.a. RRM, RBD, or RNP domain), putative [Angomonas deanei]|uniref:RNA recognition motif. (A.k.a. RRM, RBD, or RNP domain), putative n=1 Tax=Angomonas deanei TaxID=59799 RepID=A0A7G2CG34_9TRYP|nr:RNA recognition motif. (a.k.a. RRM, RBD, or RNP domain), putative [Angomonas deanei]
MSRVRISGVPTMGKEDELLQLCASFGPILDYTVSPKQMEVSYEEANDAEDAKLNMDGMVFHQQSLAVIRL